MKKFRAEGVSGLGQFNLVVNAGDRSCSSLPPCPWSLKKWREGVAPIDAFLVRAILPFCRVPAVEEDAHEARLKIVQRHEDPQFIISNGAMWEVGQEVHLWR